MPPDAAPVILTSSPICTFGALRYPPVFSVLSSLAVTLKVDSAVAPALSLTITFTSKVAADVGVKLALVAVPNSVPSVFHFVLVLLL